MLSDRKSCLYKLLFYEPVNSNISCSIWYFSFWYDMIIILSLSLISKFCCDFQFSVYVLQDIVKYINSPGGSVTTGKKFSMYVKIFLFYSSSTRGGLIFANSILHTELILDFIFLFILFLRYLKSATIVHFKNSYPLVVFTWWC